MKNRTIIIIMGIIIVILTATIIFLLVKENEIKESKQSDAEKFAEEYHLEDKDNVFVYTDIDKIIEILKEGTGVVYLGFPECKWCCQYVVYLNEVAKERHVSKIYYYNIRQDREDNTKEYQEIIEILKDYLEKDEDGNPRIYVPSVTFMSNGKILGYDDETSYDTKGFSDPSDYWTKEKVKDLKKRLNSYLDKSNICYECNS